MESIHSYAMAQVMEHVCLPLEFTIQTVSELKPLERTKTLQLCVHRIECVIRRQGQNIPRIGICAKDGTGIVRCTFFNEKSDGLIDVLKQGMWIEISNARVKELPLRYRKGDESNCEIYLYYDSEVRILTEGSYQQVLHTSINKLTTLAPYTWIGIAVVVSSASQQQSGVFIRQGRKFRWRRYMVTDDNEYFAPLVFFDRAIARYSLKRGTIINLQNILLRKTGETFELQFVRKFSSLKILGEKPTK